MLKKAIFILLTLSLCATYMVSCNTQGEDPNDKAPVYPMGDADGNGEVNEADLSLFKAYLAGEAREIHYEFCDLDGSFKVDESDAEILESYLNGETEELSCVAFGRDDWDITNKLEDLGINNLKRWGDDKIETLRARNPYDMIVSNGLVMVSGGNYQDNKGPVVINGYGRDMYEPVVMGTLATEQVNRFYDCGDFVVALAIDPRTWQYGDVYLKPAESDRWVTRGQVLVDNIHCYDMVEFNGMYFFCGSNIGYKMIDGKRIELSKSSVYRVYGELSDSMTRNDFKELKVVNKYGDVISFDSVLGEFDNKGEIIYYSTGVPRFYEFFKFKGKLYAFYYNQYSDRYDEESNFNGLYVYDEKKDRFVYDDTLNFKDLIDIMSGSVQDAEKIQHDFEWGDRYYFVKDGLYCTEDFITYKEKKIPEYKDYRVHDVIFRGDAAYVLASFEQKSGDFTNVVFETFDFEEFRPLFHFDTKLFARSFELCNGEFYFGLGFTVSTNTDAISARYSECGRIYRYTYYR